MIICTPVKSNSVSLIKNFLQTFEVIPSSKNLKTVTTLTNTHVAVQKLTSVYCFLIKFDQFKTFSAVVLPNEGYVVSKLLLSVCLSQNSIQSVRVRKWLLEFDKLSKNIW